MLAPGSMLISFMAVFKNWVMLVRAPDVRLMSGATTGAMGAHNVSGENRIKAAPRYRMRVCLLYTSDAADD